jgi:hypothetical protein
LLVKPVVTTRSSLPPLARGLAALLLVIALAVAHTPATADAATHTSFVDVNSRSVHAPAIKTVAQQGIIDPCGSSRFCPGDSVTRAQFATMLVRSLDLPSSSTRSFGDVSGRHAADIEALAAAGLTKGCTEDRFCPDTELTREQLASFFARALDATPTPSPFGDMTATHDGSVGALHARNIIKGCTTTSFCPRLQVNRAQTATMLARSLVGEPTAAAPDLVAERPTLDPGPAGDFSWKGLNWDRRSWGGPPHFNGIYDSANVVGPDANGHVTLRLTNPTGNAPRAAEISTTRRGFGYGTYSVVVDKRLDVMQSEVVWGCLFTYDGDAAPGYNEIDACEASAWGSSQWPVTQSHVYWHDASRAPGQGSVAETFAVPTTAVQTHRMVWAPGRITYETFSGEGFDGPLLKRSVLSGSTVPVPARESLHFNLWVFGGGGNPSRVSPETVTIRDLSFVPAS